ncbi:VOC family protein [Pararhizobium sp. DWP1-1-3]|uniref:VOC family protein n=1 Tax=Pararhizobium sp. DWP1-1-3 TaxID=2804652 RepID=UPI003CF29DEA
MKLDAIEVITLFVDDIDEARSFYQTAFAAEIVYQDAVSAVLKFAGTMVNLLKSTEAPELVAPSIVAKSSSGSRVLLTIKVDDTDGACAELQRRGVTLLNGPVDRPWGRRTAAFADPSGHVWEIAQELS